ncbi:aspartate 4-decarboxylase [Paenibacillus sp. N1-5-1-14]|uniref:aspartate 4-decarboxylase n=1 Tax=Paenibacillus radicibacter TaxID=2972488 RepID=UPI002159045F|nr:aspartate 4-decarboxylase [Paenibacillus radicibacter]MCR8642785.1 aspartate 4-decarboxylase [Paenibacillus radicibacter]
MSSDMDLENIESLEGIDNLQRREFEKIYGEISPFELKNKLIDFAKGSSKKSARIMLNAGRGNPNWTASTPRDAFFTLGHFAVGECRRVWEDDHLAGMPEKEGIAGRLDAFLRGEGGKMPGAEMLRSMVHYAIDNKGFEPDAWVHEIVDGIIGDNYPVPDRMLIHIEQVVKDYVIKEMFQGEDIGKFQIYATEGATAAMCYIFDTMVANSLLDPGDRIAILVPVFTPYLEIPRLPRYNFDVVYIEATEMTESNMHAWQFPTSEIDKLKDKSIKALFAVNPSNPPSIAMKPESVQQIVDIVKNDNPNLMVISDDVYGTFVHNFRSMMTDIPYNTIGVYSFSKYYGVTGWRLGIISVCEDNVFDKLISRLSDENKERLDKRYGELTLHPEDVKFIDRIVADSRQVALNHTAGLSTPQQVQMAMFCLFALMDKEDKYKHQTMEICRRRKKLLFDGLGLELEEDPYDASYYTQIDILVWAANHYDKGFVEYLEKTYEPIDILFRLAEESSIVLLNGGGFSGPEWSVRVSLANLRDEAYARIGEVLRLTLNDYVKAWEETKK